MTISVSVIICSLLYSMLVTIVYFSKKRLKTKGNALYSTLMVINIIGLILELLCCYFVLNYEKSALFSFINILVTKIDLIYLVSWITIFTAYIYIISYRKDKEKEKTSKIQKNSYYIITAIYAIMIFLVTWLPLYYNNGGGYVYSYGPATNSILVYAVLTIIFDFICLFRNFESIKDKKYFPLFALVFIMSLAAVIRMINPGITVINSSFAFITVLMFFTIENPDLKMILELKKNRELLESSVNDKSNFLFKVSGEVKKPLSDALKLINEYNDKYTKVKTKELLENIKTNINSAMFVTNDISNISSEDVKNIKFKDNIYETDKFIKTLELNVKNSLNEQNKQNINFNLDVVSNLPKKLSGDNIKLKQVILSLVSNSIKYTKEGFISIEVDNIQKYDVCRLIFTIKDSGCGMDISKINDILSIKDIEVNDNISDDLNLKMDKIMKIIHLLGASINIKSKEGKGTTITLVIDQMINDKQQDKIDSTLKNYDTAIYNNKKVLLLNDNELTNEMNSTLSKYDIDVITSLIEDDAINGIKSGDKYDVIVIKDDMTPYSAYEFLTKLKEIKKFKTPVIVLLKENKLKIKKHYLEDGFSDYIDMSNLEDEIKRIIEKYI